MARWVKVWDFPEDHWLNDDIRFFGMWIKLIRKAEPKPRKIIRYGQMLETKRGAVYTSVNELATEWHVTRRLVDHFLQLCEQDGMVSVQRMGNRGINVFISNYAKYQDKPDNKRATERTTDSTTNSTTNSTTDSTTEASFFRTNNKEYTEYTEGERGENAPPTRTDVRTYITENKFAIDPTRFYEYYSARSWKGITDWKAAVRAWVARDGTGSKHGTKPAAKKFDNFEPRQDSGSAMDQLIRQLQEG